MMNALVPVSAAAAFTVSDVEKVATAIARGGLFGSKDPYAVLTLCLLAQAEGQHPAVVFRDYHIIQGKPAKKADAMLRDFVGAGGKVEWHQLDDTVADATFSHPGGGTVRIDWTLKRAQQAGLATPMWKKYPRQMLRSRVISEGVRTVYPGATSGLYVPEEVSSFEDPKPEPERHHEEPEQPQPEANGKVPGIHKIKQNIRAMKARGDAATTREELDAILGEYAADMNTLQDCGHSWWTGKDGDGNEFEGIPAWIDRRQSEIDGGDSMYKMLIDSMKTCDTKPILDNWRVTNDALISTLDDAEGRKFQTAFELHESAIRLVDTADA